MTTDDGTTDEGSRDQPRETEHSVFEGMRHTPQGGKRCKVFMIEERGVELNALGVRKWKDRRHRGKLSLKNLLRAFAW